ncbi:hypothetical protein K435DRAFT_884527 [Dendrothele bispora CBS 962.96]|uniref:DUF659 domain-containing protein n=1 Tax=Dendrothele bispora (strain CBS 962.96) TaxID=1314807 RepID=A0A4S8KTY3_DENBC|nr:hypothetical protein K435DRAFT_884527 [Dendrothele bispora CBS 962.96]
MAPNPLWNFFIKGGLQNSSQHEARCSACVQHYLDVGKQALEDGIRNEDDTIKLRKRQEAYNEALQAVGTIRGEKNCMIIHILGPKRGNTSLPCPYASQEAKNEAEKQRAEEEKKKERKDGEEGKSNAGRSSTLKRAITNDSEPQNSGTQSHSVVPPSKRFKQSKLKTFNALDMPFSKEEAAAVKAQALRAIVSSKAKEGLFEDPEMLKLVKMLRKDAVEVMPTARVIGGRLLNEAASKVEGKLEERLKGQHLGISTDQWKNIRKDSIAAVCINVDGKAYTIKLCEVTALNKDGEVQCAEFERMIDEVENKYDCVVLYLVTDADGGSKKGRVLLGKKRPWLIVPSCWAHQFQLTLGDYFKVYQFGAAIAEDATFLVGDYVLGLKVGFGIRVWEVVHAFPEPRRFKGVERKGTFHDSSFLSVTNIGGSLNLYHHLVRFFPRLVSHKEMGKDDFLTANETCGSSIR